MSNEYYVYAAYVEEECVYVGSGKGKRFHHVTSGCSHNKGLNALYFQDRAPVVVLLEEGLSKVASLESEQCYIEKLSPSCNRNDAKRGPRKLTTGSSKQKVLLECCAKTLITDLGIKQIDKAVLSIICAHISETFCARLFHRQVCDMLGVEIQTISNSVKRLRDADLIKSVATAYGNLYYVNSNKIVDAHNNWLVVSGKTEVESDATKDMLLYNEDYDLITTVIQEHKRNVGGLVQNKKPCYVEEDIESPF